MKLSHAEVMKQTVHLLMDNNPLWPTWDLEATMETITRKLIEIAKHLNGVIIVPAAKN